MNAVDVGAWNANWAWSLPLIVLNVVIHVIGLGLINESVVRVSERCDGTPPFHAHVRGGYGRRCSVGYCTAWNRGGYLGDSLPASRRPTRHQVCDALFTQRNDKLRTREPLSGRAVAANGCLGGVERDASVRTD